MVAINNLTDKISELASVQRITLDIGDAAVRQTVFAKQYDKQSRYILADVCSGGSPVSLPNGTTVLFRFIKPDETTVLSQCRFSDSEVLIELGEQALCVSGTGIADIAFCHDGSVI